MPIIVFAVHQERTASGGCQDMAKRCPRHPFGFVKGRQRVAPTDGESLRRVGPPGPLLPKLILAAPRRIARRSIFVGWLRLSSRVACFRDPQRRWPDPFPDRQEPGHGKPVIAVVAFHRPKKKARQKDSFPSANEAKICFIRPTLRTLHPNDLSVLDAGFQWPCRPQTASDHPERIVL